MRKSRSELRPLVILRISSIAVAPKASRRPRNTAALFSCGIISLRWYWIGGQQSKLMAPPDRWRLQGFWAQSLPRTPQRNVLIDLRFGSFAILLEVRSVNQLQD